MNIFITGKPGCGKSSLVKELIKEFKDKKIAGIITPEIRKEKRGREGFEIIDLASGEKEILASVDIKGPRVSKYGINIEGINSIVEKFEKSFDKAKLIFIDEIGKMEFYSEKFRDILDKILNSDKTIIATLHQNFINKFRDKGKIFNLTKENREQIKKEISNKLY